MKIVHLIVVGKLKDKHLQAVEQEWHKRINMPELKISEVKASAEDKDIEADLVLKKIHSLAKSSSPHIVLLAEDGKKFSSMDFEKWYYQRIDRHQNLFLVIGGSCGHGQKILDRANEKISLSALTFPHQLARVVIVEQLYRAQTIHQGHPYHN
jgi:23S rRNA (pseudouridine1915-N3)-methyltransferase